MTKDFLISENNCNQQMFNVLSSSFNVQYYNIHSIV